MAKTTVTGRWWKPFELRTDRDQKTLCYLGKLNGSAQARWLKTIEVFNQQGEAEQLKLFPSHIEPPADEKVPADMPWSRIAALLTINRLCAPGSELAIERQQ